MYVCVCVCVCMCVRVCVCVVVCVCVNARACFIRARVRVLCFNASAIAWPVIKQRCGIQRWSRSILVAIGISSWSFCSPETMFECIASERPGR